ncbi:hypothetical protein [Nocardioides marinisabuli]|uniref:hypothetical protein n=1 Tax=Nocardioides marinisabuli TaxID=419476 RepID=UPI002155A621|nr:hypothetical protein [Nocardioides marinisabuli]
MVGSGWPPAAVGGGRGRRGQVGVEVDVRRPGQVALGVLAGPGGATEAVADVEERHDGRVRVVEEAAEHGGADERTAHGAHRAARVGS